MVHGLCALLFSIQISDQNFDPEIKGPSSFFNIMSREREREREREILFQPIDRFNPPIFLFYFYSMTMMMIIGDESSDT